MHNLTDSSARFFVCIRTVQQILEKDTSELRRPARHGECIEESFDSCVF